MATTSFAPWRSAARVKVPALAPQSNTTSLACTPRVSPPYSSSTCSASSSASAWRSPAGIQNDPAGVATCSRAPLGLDHVHFAFDDAGGEGGLGDGLAPGVGEAASRIAVFGEEGKLHGAIDRGSEGGTRPPGPVIARS